MAPLVSTPAQALGAVLAPEVFTLVVDTAATGGLQSEANATRRWEELRVFEVGDDIGCPTIL